MWSVQATWVQGQLSEVRVDLANPLPFTLTVEMLTIAAGGVPFDAYPCSRIVLPPHCKVRLWAIALLSVCMAASLLGSTARCMRINVATLHL